MNKLESYYQGKRVLLTGHTGFKGAWMSEWLLGLGADLVGVSLEPNTTPSLFDQLDLASRMEHHILDICEGEQLVDLVKDAQPDIVFHLAAQPLVRYSYESPVETFSTNIMGTIHLMEGIRQLTKRCEAVMITTDKCYENRERLEPYREDDPMGGHDPYSASKGAAELVIASYRRSFFDPAKYGSTHQISLASARAGNVIGGGDWALDRIVPDCMRTLAQGQAIHVRNVGATRPWQHVLEPLGGYLLLALGMAEAKGNARRAEVCSGFNFGPDPDDNRAVSELVEQVLALWPGAWQADADPHPPHEANLLNLAIDKAERLLSWKPVWDFDRAITHTVDWYRSVHDGEATPLLKTQSQIHEYTELFYNEI